MGAKSSNTTPRKFQDKYVGFLRAKQKRFLLKDKKANNIESFENALSFVSDAGEETIDWKDFFEDYLFHHTPTCFWAEKLLLFFQSVYISQEKRWLDMMFFERFSNSFIPVVSDQSIIDFQDYSKSVLEEWMIKVNPDNSCTSLASVPDSSFLYSHKDPAVKNLALAIYKALKKENYPFHRIIQEFKRLFIEEYSSFLQEIQKDRDSIQLSEEEKVTCPYSQALMNLNVFIRLVMYSLSLFYKPVIGVKNIITLRELLLNAVMNITIRDEIYTILFELAKIKNEEQEVDIIQKIEKIKSLTPKALGVNEYLRLDESSAMVRAMEGLYQNPPAPSVPYTSAIIKLQEIGYERVPLRKLAAISNLNSVICDCVNDFWKNTSVKREKLQMDADQYLSLLLYIMSKANVKYLYSEITLAQDLLNLGSKSSYYSYCLTSLQACFTHLLTCKNQIVVSRKPPVSKSKKIQQKRNKSLSSRVIQKPRSRRLSH